MLLRRNGADEMVALAEEAEGLALEVKEGGNGLEEEVGALKVRLSLIHVVGVLQEQGGDAEPCLHLDDRQEGDRALAYRLQALYGLPDFTLLLFVVRQQPQPLCHLFHLLLSFSFQQSTSASPQTGLKTEEPEHTRRRRRRREGEEDRGRVLVAAALGWDSTSKSKQKLAEGYWFSQSDLGRFQYGSLFSSPPWKDLFKKSQ